MGYIINNSDAFINIKLTDTGRQKLAQGQLNFASWAIGDSEINYDKVFLTEKYSFDESLSGDTRIHRPYDRQPNITSFITSTTSDANNLNALTPQQIHTVKATINNQATDRGFFSKTGSTYTTQSGTTYIKSTGTLAGAVISGGTSLVIGTGDKAVNDLILLKLNNDTVGTLPLGQNTVPVPHLWYRIQSTGTTLVNGDTVTLDRPIPDIDAVTATSQFIVYNGGTVYGDFGFEETTPYWNSNTLAFASCCDVSAVDVPVWNMNNVWDENLAGMTGTSLTSTTTLPNESFEKFGSMDYLGQKYPYFGYSLESSTRTADTSTTSSDPCNNDSPGQSIKDPINKSIALLHYTNNTISNYYGEFLYIDGENNKTVNVRVPDLMYHRRDFSTASGTTMGMDFIATGSTQLITDTEIEYVTLIEDPTLVADTPRVVGRVFPQLKTIVFDDDEIVAAMSYKSNRNWTLPALSANLIASVSGTTAGLLQTNETMYITYSFENSSGSGLTTTLPCQYYTKITNNTSNTKDVQFKIGDVDLLPYMRKIEQTGYDGLGFFAKEFKVLYQILDNQTDRPVSNAWKVYDYTSTSITNVGGESIHPILLENQNPVVNGFLIDTDVDTAATTFSIIDSMSMAINASPDILQFGDERFFYGNIETYIGARIYKSVFNLNISSDDFKTTENPTRDDSLVNTPDIRIGELGIYDNSGDLVMISKLSRPIRLKTGNTIMVELSMDF